MTLQPDEMLAGFRVVEKIGEGGMGEVYRANQHALNRTVALKVLQTSDTGDELESRFDREINVHIQLSHPNLVKVYDAGRTKGFRYIAMELVEGSTLRQVIRESVEASWDRVAAQLRQILEALAYLEKSCLIHRDLKPENILVDRQGTLKIADFGLVKSDTATILTQANQVVGTLKYLAPEILRGEPITPKADVYAAGLIFHELLTGQLPYAGTDTTTWLQAILYGKPPPLRDFRQDLSGVQESLVARLLEKNPEVRPNAAEALQLLDEPGMAGGSAGRRPSSRTVVRRTTGIMVATPAPAVKTHGILLAGAVLMGIVALGLLQLDSRRAVDSDPSTQVQAPSRSPGIPSAGARPEAPSRRLPVSWVRVLPPTLPPGLPVVPHWSFSLTREGGVAMTASDWKEVFEHNRKLESDEEPDTLFALAVLHGRGLGTPRNLDKARHFLRKAVRGGNGFAQLAMGWDAGFSRGPDGEQLDEQSYEKLTQKWLQDRARQGVAAAQLEHGRSLLHVEKRIEEALAMLELAANQGHTVAMEELGNYFTAPEKNPRDQERALHWFRRGAERGDAICMHRIAWILHNALKVPRDISGAIQLCERSYSAGEPWGAYHLGVILLERNEVPLANQWFRRSLDLCGKAAFSEMANDGVLENLLTDRGHSRGAALARDMNFVSGNIGF